MSNFFNPTDCSLPGSSAHGIFQARILEWGAISSSRRSSPPRDQTHISCVSCTGRCTSRFVWNCLNFKIYQNIVWLYGDNVEKAMASHSSTLAWKIPWMEKPGRLWSMGSLRVGHNWATSLSLFSFTHWRRKWQPTPVFLPGESQGWGAWWADVYGVALSRTQLKWLSLSWYWGTWVPGHIMCRILADWFEH